MVFCWNTRGNSHRSLRCSFENNSHETSSPTFLAKRENVFVKHYAPNYMHSSYLQAMTKIPATFQIDQYKNVSGVAHTRYPPSVVKYLSRKREIIPQGEPQRKNEKKKKKKKKKKYGSAYFSSYI